ncbi:phage tail protein [Burkholderia arboris]|uniref:Contractile injection system protein, VgrG/Pvc8 family n=1 Tax=Burkholderia metallica TaxID=488729 RepID=A0ABT8PJ62_9BURK|nr:MULTISPECIES: contractile injection system protein, VgrG/Pvc8 family [Burkholderia cepacia complex]MCA8032026.1 phage tail protein [Burkholderia arboris]MDN7935197.1 contractile injection system protein, VgrG/Pvc8 family [Burkholderia metallica]
MTPRYRITAWDKDITALVADRLLSASVTDEAGIEADQFTMTLDDRDNVLAWPEKGAKLAVWLGYVETGLLKMGDYIVDEIEYSEPPATMVIRAKAADYANAYLKSQKTRSWPKNMTIGDLVKKIAAEHKLKPLVSKSLAAIKLPATHQTEESDLNLLTRIAKDYNAIAKPAAGSLLFVVKGESRDANGKPLPVVTVTKGGKTTVRVVEADRGKYQSVVAYFHNPKTGKRDPVRFETGEPTFTMKYNYPDRAQAQKAAEAKHKALARQSKRLSLTMPGEPKTVAETRLTLDGFRDGVNGDWVAVSVRHDFGNNGFSTAVDAEQYLPDAGNQVGK